MFEEMWNYDWEEFIYTIFYLRKHRRNPRREKGCQTEIVGRGERKIFHQVIIWMSHHKLSVLIRILPHIPNYGYWKDLLVLMGTPAESDVVKLFGDQLIRDYISYHSPIPGLISMAAKWTPNEGSSSDIRHNTYGKIARHMKVSRKILRKQYLVPLRQYLPVTEQMVSTKQWSLINYNMVPQLCLKLHAKSFYRNDYSRFADYINVSHIDYVKKLILPPYVEATLMKNSLKRNPPEPDITFKSNLDQTTICSNHDEIQNPNNPVIEGVQFNHYTGCMVPSYEETTKINSIPKTGDTTINQKVRVNRTIKAIDVSGSMSGFPMALAGCMCVENNDNQWIPFRFDGNNDRKVFDITGDTCADRINSIMSATEKDIPGCDLLTCIELARSIDRGKCIDQPATNYVQRTSDYVIAGLPSDYVVTTASPAERGNSKADSLNPGFTGKTHLIVITNTLVDESEFPKHENDNEIPLHITYWVVTMNPVNIIDREGMTVIEGYDINVYNALVNQRSMDGCILDRNSYNNIIMTEVHKDNILSPI